VKLLCLLLTLLLTNTPLLAKSGKVTGGQVYSIPDWFKLSLLDINEDFQEASKSEKHIMLFMHLKACPYCSRMLDENFRKGDNKKYMQKHFDVIAINIRGDKEITWTDKKSYSETELAKKIGVVATPTIVFLNTKGKKILQLNGYRKPLAFRYALEYVQSRQYAKSSLTEYLKLRQNKPVYKFLEHAYLKKMPDLTGYKKPLAILFEDKDCVGCQEFHKKVLGHKAVLPELEKFLFVRLDSYSPDLVTNLTGKKIKPARWAKQLGLNYRPGMALYNNGKLVSVVNGRLYHFHFKETLRYVSGRYFEKYDSFSQYLQARQKELLSQGIDIDLSE